MKLSKDMRLGSTIPTQTGKPENVKKCPALRDFPTKRTPVILGLVSDLSCH
jgi:hypothetical protein